MIREHGLVSPPTPADQTEMFEDVAAARVDVVVVAYRSTRTLRRCVEELSRAAAGLENQAASLVDVVAGFRIDQAGSAQHVRVAVH